MTSQTKCVTEAIAGIATLPKVNTLAMLLAKDPTSIAMDVLGVVGTLSGIRHVEVERC